MGTMDWLWWGEGNRIISVFERSLWLHSRERIWQTAGVVEVRNNVAQALKGQWVWREGDDSRRVWRKIRWWVRHVEESGWSTSGSLAGGAILQEREQRIGRRLVGEEKGESSDWCRFPTVLQTSTRRWPVGTWVYGSGTQKCELIWESAFIDSTNIYWALTKS